MLAWLLEEFGILPDEGSALDQEEALMNDIQMCWWIKMMARNTAEKNEQERRKALDFARGRS